MTGLKKQHQQRQRQQQRTSKSTQKNNKQGLKISYTSLKLIASKEGLQLIVFHTLYRPYL